MNKAKKAATDPPDNMGKLGYLIGCQAGNYFLPDKQQCDQDKCNGDLTAFRIRKADQQDQHEYNPTGSHQTGMEKKYIQKAGNQGSYDNHKQGAATAIFLFHNRTHQEYEGEITHQVFDTRMT